MYEASSEHHFEGDGEGWKPFDPCETGVLMAAQAKMAAEYIRNNYKPLKESSQSFHIVPVRESAQTVSSDSESEEEGETESTAPPSQLDKEIGYRVDANLVQKYLNSKPETVETLKLLVEDFGGQDCFYELYSLAFSEYAVSSSHSTWSGCFLTAQKRSWTLD